MKNRVFALVLVAALLLSGCVQVGVDPGSTGGTTVPTTTNATEPTIPTDDNGLYPANRSDIFCQYLPAQVDASGGVPVIKWLVLGTNEKNGFSLFRSDYVWSESAVQEVNAMAAQLEQPFQIQFVLFTTTSPKEVDWFRVPEVLEAMEQCDLIAADFEAGELDQYLQPLTEYIDGALKNAVPHEAAWESASVGGQVYGIPCYMNYATANGWVVSEEVFTQFGLSQKTFSRDFWDMSRVFAQLYEANGNQGFLSPEDNTVRVASYNGIDTQLPSSIADLVQNRYDLIGGCFAVDYSGEKPRVVNLLRTEFVRDTLEAMWSYAEKGYYAKSSEDVLLDYGTCYSAGVTVYEGSGRTWYYISQGDFVYDTQVSLTTGILRFSKKTSHALALLQQLSENQELRKLLLWGREGVDYTVTEDGWISKARDDGSYNMEFLFPMDLFDMETWGGADITMPAKEGSTRLETYRDTVSASQVWPEISFDYSTVMEETEQVLKVMNANKFSINTMGPEVYDLFLKNIQAAGEEYIIAELQMQLEAWLEANPGALG